MHLIYDVAPYNHLIKVIAICRGFLDCILFHEGCIRNGWQQKMGERGSHLRHNNRGQIPYFKCNNRKIKAECKRKISEQSVTIS